MTGWRLERWPVGRAGRRVARRQKLSGKLIREIDKEEERKDENEQRFEK